MFENRPLLELTLGRSTVRQRILAVLMDESVVRLHLREIQRRAQTSPGTASRELARLVGAGLVIREAEGNQVYFRASDSPFAAMLRSLLVAMPSPKFKPRPARVPRAKPAPSETDQSQDQTAGEGSTAVAADVRPPVGATSASTPEATPLGPMSATPETTAAESLTTMPTVAVGQFEVLGHTRQPDDTPRLIVPRPAPPRPADAPDVNSTAATANPESAAVRRLPPDPVGLQVAGRFAESIRPAYGEMLRGVYLYGVRASGPAPADADVETIVVLERVEQYGAELERTSHVCAAMSRELNLVVSRIFVSESDWDGGGDGKLPAIRSEAVAV